MIERTYVSRSAFLAAGIAAVLTFLLLVVISNRGNRAPALERSSPAKRVAAAPSTPKPAPSRPPLTLVAQWSPPPAEFVKLTAPVSIYNSRGKEVKQFSVGKRLRVSKRAGDQITIDYLGDQYSIATTSTMPSE